MPELIERTLVLVKPDGFDRKLVGKILARYEEKRLNIVQLKKLTMTCAIAERFYAVHKNEKFFGDLVSFMTSGPIVAVVLEGYDAVSVVRRLNGKTHDAYPGTIRGDFGETRGRNVVHGSDSVENARKEIRVLFSSREIHSWDDSG